MKSKLLSVYTDASGDDSKGTIAFSVWDNKICIGRFTSVLNEYDLGDSNVLELIAIRTALSWVRENYPEKKIKLVTDSDSAVRYINHKHLDKEPYRSIADEIKEMHLIEHIGEVRTQTVFAVLPCWREEAYYVHLQRSLTVKYQCETRLRIIVNGT